MSVPDFDAWELAGFPGRLNVAAYLTADQAAAQYRLIVDVLLDAQEHSLTGVGRDDLLAAVRGRVTASAGQDTAERLTHPDVFDLDSRMRSLHNWGVIDRWQDKAKSEADFIPSVLIAAADELGVRSRPLVCTNGRPSAAAFRLVSGLAASGATLHVRADDDAVGQDIVARIQAAIPAIRLWRYTLRPSDVRRFEEQDLSLLLLDLTITDEVPAG